MLGAMWRHFRADYLADEMRFNGYRMTAGMRTRSNAKNKNGAPKLIEAMDLPSRAQNALENGLGLPAIWLTHAAKVRHAKNSHYIALPHCAAVNVLDARSLRGWHGT